MHPCMQHFADREAGRQAEQRCIRVGGHCILRGISTCFLVRCQFCPTLQSPWSCSHHVIRNIIVGPIVSDLPFITSWTGMLHSFVAWIQISFLNRFPNVQ